MNVQYVPMSKISKQSESLSSVSGIRFIIVAATYSRNRNTPLNGSSFLSISFSFSLSLSSVEFFLFLPKLLLSIVKSAKLSIGLHLPLLAISVSAISRYLLPPDPAPVSVPVPIPDLDPAPEGIPDDVRESFPETLFLPKSNLDGHKFDAL